MSIHMLTRTFFETLSVIVKSGRVDLAYRCRCGSGLNSCHVWKITFSKTDLPDMVLNYKDLEANNCTDPDFNLFYDWLRKTIHEQRLVSQQSLAREQEQCYAEQSLAREQDRRAEQSLADHRLFEQRLAEQILAEQSHQEPVQSE